MHGTHLDAGCCPFCTALRAGPGGGHALACFPSRRRRRRRRLCAQRCCCCCCCCCCWRARCCRGCGGGGWALPRGWLLLREAGPRGWAVVHGRRARPAECPTRQGQSGVVVASSSAHTQEKGAKHGRQGAAPPGRQLPGSRRARQPRGGGGRAMRWLRGSFAPLRRRPWLQRLLLLAQGGGRRGARPGGGRRQALGGGGRRGQAAPAGRGRRQAALHAPAGGNCGHVGERGWGGG